MFLLLLTSSKTNSLFNVLHFGFPIKRLVALLLFTQIFFAAPAYPWDAPFDNAANWGGTGLMEIPTARILDDGVIRASVAQALPFRWFTAGMGVFPGFEFTGRFTGITNIPSGLGPGYGSNKDKAFDLKYQILPESRWLPALAVGWNDFVGTALFESQYVALSRQIFPFDFTVGYGTKRFNGPFAGIEVSLHPRLHFMAEYNPIDYASDKPSARGVPQGAEWPVNFGLRYKLFPVIDLGVSYQRGDTLGVSLNFQTELGKPIVPRRADPPPLVDVDRRPFTQRDKKEMVEKIHGAIQGAGFGEVTVYTDGLELCAEFANTLYLSNQKAVGRVLRMLLLHAPGDTKKLRAVVKRKGIPILSVSVKPAVLESYLLGDVPDEVFLRLVEVELTHGALKPDEKTAAYAEGEKDRLSYGIKPDVESYLNDPSGIFKYRVGVKPWTVVDLWKGGQGYARLDLPFYSTIQSSNIPPANTVREDSWKYLGDDWSFNSLMVDQTIRFTERTFGRLSLGYLEYMYAGAGGEILHFFGEGNVAVGIQGDWVRKREPGSTLGLQDFAYYDLLANAYFRFPKLAVTLQTQYGRFMAGDVGWLFTVTREYDTGVIIGGWYGYTDTEDLTGFSKGYNSNGVFLRLPARMFMGHDSPTRYSYGMAPWSRDASATVYQWQTIFDIAGNLMPGLFRSRLSEIKE